MSAPVPFGPFLLDARIAVGGTAEVYLARPATPDPSLPPRLVVKRLLPHFVNDPEGRTMFEREARLHAAVTHDNVVTVFGAGADARGEPYLAMEYIDGVDGYRLLRRLRQANELLAVGVTIYIAREVLRALESVHAARDPLSGGALGIVHRDVSPSNIYLSKDGKVKLGDFGIARSTTRATLRSETGTMLKGKFAYLAPEQVAGEPSDHRADLFSLGSVLAEILLNRPLFPGGGQLAILLAIRDCKVDALSEVKARLPPGLFEVLTRALSRNPANRFQTATDFAEALAPFEADPKLAVHEISARVRWVQAATSTDQMPAARVGSGAMAAVRAGSGAMRAIKPAVETPNVKVQLRAETAAAAAVPRPAPASPPAPDRAVASDAPPHRPYRSDPPDDEDEPEPKTEEYERLPSWVRKASGERLGPWTFARLMEGLATGSLQRGDKVDFVGRGFRDVEEIEEFARFFPPPSATTGKLAGPGAPDFHDHLDTGTMLHTLMRVLSQHDTGVLFAERAAETGARSGTARKELYFVGGKLHHVASSNASELLGEYLVRRGKLEREELDLALAVLPRYGGRMGDTLISMGLVGPVDIFRAIREQGRDRVADLFTWTSGTLTFYRGHVAPPVEFPLDLDLPTLMLAGFETAKPGDALLAERSADLERVLQVRADPSRDDLLGGAEAIVWPPVIARVQSLVKQELKLGDVLKAASRVGGLTAGDVLRSVEILMAAGLLAWKA